MTSLPCKVPEQSHEPTWKKIHTLEVEKFANSDNDNQNCIIIHAQCSVIHGHTIMLLISVRGVSSSVSPSVAAARTPHVASSESAASASPSPDPAATSRRSIGGCDPRLVGPLRHHLEVISYKLNLRRCKYNISRRDKYHLDLSAPEQRVIQSHRSLDWIFVCELYVGEPFGLPVILVA